MVCYKDVLCTCRMRLYPHLCTKYVCMHMLCWLMQLQSVVKDLFNIRLPAGYADSAQLLPKKHFPAPISCTDYFSICTSENTLKPADTKHWHPVNSKAMHFTRTRQPVPTSISHKEPNPVPNVPSSQERIFRPTSCECPRAKMWSGRHTSSGLTSRT